jgi:predicted transcriptional regulator
MSDAQKRKKKQVKRRTWLMPQELEVWYVLPSLRREMARLMIKKGIPQKDIAGILGVTEPAVTQYKLAKSKRSRGDVIEIPDSFTPEIERSVDAMVKAWQAREPDKYVYQAMTKEVNRLIRALRDAGIMCDVHRGQCEEVEEECRACKDGGR